MRFVKRRNSRLILIHVALVVIGVGLRTPSATGQTYLYSRADLATGNTPSSMIAADLNGDGKLDFAVANQSDNTVSVLLGRPDGSFAAKVDYVTGLAPVAVVAADFNGDGKLDLAVVNSQAGAVSILLGVGDGTFQVRVDFSVGSNPLGMVAADFNGDNKIDLAVTNQAGNSVSILLGNGDGTFRSGTTVGVGTTPIALASGDFNNDGKLDLVTSNRNGGSISVLLGGGDGTFRRTDFPVAVANSATGSVVVGDLNGDGKPDVLVLQPFANQISLFLGNGDGSFQSPTQIFLTFPPSSLVATDLDHDGKLDLVFAGTVPIPAIGVLFGKGNGTFQPEVDSHAPYLTSLVLGDFNGDSMLDIVGTSGQGVSVVLGNGNGAFGRASEVPLGGRLSASVGKTLVADFNGDGKPDVAVVLLKFFPAQIAVRLGNGDGTFQNVRTSALTFSGPHTLAAGDFNGDGKMDVVILTPGAPGISVLLSNGDGTFKPSLPVPLGPGLSPQRLSVGDFNGDGKADLAVVAGDNLGNISVNVLLSNGDGTFRSGAQYALGARFSAGDTISVDFNHDGKLDLAIPNAFTSVVIMMGNGDGTFKGPFSYGVSGTNNTVAAADFNGDGHLDISVATNTGLSILLGNGDGTFKVPPVNTTTIPNITFTSNLLVGDFNGDGKMDVANGGFVLAGNGDGTFRASTPYRLSAISSSNAAGDFNSDGITDLVIANDIFGFPSATMFLSAPSVNLHPTLLTFASQQVGLPGSPQTLTLTNIGNAPLAIRGITLTGDYSQTNTCGLSVAIGVSCVVSVTFTPILAGARTGTLVFTDNATPGPQIVRLNGTGIAPVVSLSPTSLTFTSQSVGTASAAQPVTLTNSGNAPLSITSVASSGDFSQTNTCGATVAAGANCRTSVTFKPTVPGTRSGMIMIADNAAGSPHTVNLSGAGTGATVDFISLSVTFAGQNVGTTSAAQTVTLRNIGNAPLNITNIAVGGANSLDFAIAAAGTTCSTASPVAAGASCTINLTFTSPAAGSRTATLTIAHNAAGSPHAVTLSGTGTDFTLAAAPGSSTNATVTAGLPASYTLAFSGSTGYVGTVSLNCSGAPALSVCSIEPTSLNLNGTNVLTAKVTVTTTARSFSLPTPRALPPQLLLHLLPAVASLGILLAVALALTRSRKAWLALATLLLLVTSWTACGGGAPAEPPVRPGTPAGTYTLSLTGTGAGTLTHSIPLTLTVL